MTPHETIKKAHQQVIEAYAEIGDAILVKIQQRDPQNHYSVDVDEKGIRFFLDVPRLTVQMRWKVGQFVWFVDDGIYHTDCGKEATIETLVNAVFDQFQFDVAQFRAAGIRYSSHVDAL